MSKQTDNLTTEVDVNPRTPMYRPVSEELFRQLMERTGDGSSVTVRDLAAVAGLSKSTVGNLLTGEKEAVEESAALALAHRLGVDLLVIFEPVCRATTTPAEYAALVRADEEVPA